MKAPPLLRAWRDGWGRRAARPAITCASWPTRARIVEDPELGTRHERWWRRPEEQVIAPTHADAEGRAVGVRTLAMLFARDEDVRHRFVTGSPSDDLQRAAFVGNWFIDLTPQEADELGRQLFAMVDELRRRSTSPPGAAPTLVSVRVLPVLD